MSEVDDIDVHNLSTVKNIASFIEVYASKSPDTMIHYMPLLKKHIDSPAYQMRFFLLMCLFSSPHKCISFRSALLQVISAIIKFIHELRNDKLLTTNASNCLEDQADGNDHEEPAPGIQDHSRIAKSSFRMRDDLLDVIIERTHDKNHFTRAVVLKVWESLLLSGI
jgi:hypothetical protein